MDQISVINSDLSLEKYQAQKWCKSENHCTEKMTDGQIEIFAQKTAAASSKGTFRNIYLKFEFIIIVLKLTFCDLIINWIISNSKFAHN